MVAVLELDEVVEHFALVDEDLGLLCNKSGATRPAFALLLKFLAWRGRFPRGRSELADNAVDRVARQVQVPAGELGFYDWSGRQAKRHRVEIPREQFTLLDHPNFVRALGSIKPKLAAGGEGVDLVV